MFTRRQLLLTAAFSAAAPLRPLNLFAAPTEADSSAALSATFDRIVDRRLTLSPEGATSFGLDTGAHAAARSLLDDRSLAGRDLNRRNTATELKEIRAFRREKLSHADAVNYDTVTYGLEIQVLAGERFPAMDNAGMPYVIFQLGGACRYVPDFLDREHKIESRSDAEAYLARLQAFANTLDQENETASHDVAAGVRPPTFALDKARTQVKALRDQTAAQSRLVQSVVERAAEKGIAGDWNARATELYSKQIQPARDN